MRNVIFKLMFSFSKDVDESNAYIVEAVSFYCYSEKAGSSTDRSNEMKQMLEELVQRTIMLIERTKQLEKDFTWANNEIVKLKKINRSLIRQLMELVGNWPQLRQSYLLNN